MSTRLFPRCFEAHWDPTTKAWHLLLEDLTDSHIIATKWPLPPTMEQCQRMVHVLARFHAEWWDDPRRGISIGTWLDGDAIVRVLQRFEIQFRIFAGRLGDRLPQERRDLYERFLDAGPRLFVRYHAHRHLSLIHGDAHVWNYFLPRDDADDTSFGDAVAVGKGRHHCEMLPWCAAVAANRDWTAQNSISMRRSKGSSCPFVSCGIRHS